MTTPKNKWQLNGANISEVSESITQELTGSKADKKEIANGLLLLEELSMCILEQDEEAVMEVSVTKRLGDIGLSLSYQGESYNPLEEENIWQESDENYYRRIIICSNKEKLGYSWRNKKNRIGIQLHTSGSKRIYVTLIAMLAGILTGLLLKAFAGGTVSGFLSDNVFDIIKTMFLNALKMMIAPVVFFSIAGSISGLTNFSEFGKIGGKLLLTYMLTTVLAIAIGTGIGLWFSQGSLSPVTAGAEALDIETVKVSIPKLIQDIVPKNLVSPIIEGNMLQIIFVAVISGMAISLLREKVDLIAQFFEQMNALSLKVVMMIVKFVPAASFCAMASLIINMGTDSLMIVLRIVAGVLICCIFMLCIYALIIAIFGRLKPMIFIKKILGFMLTPLSLGSSNATMPFAMDFCTNKMGISTKLSSFSIPIGATVNMDGTSSYLALACIIFLKMYGRPIDAGVLFTIFISVLVLSVGAPGVPGSGIICLSTMVATLGLPLECVGLVLGIDQLMGMVRSAFNVSGDIAVSTAIAKSEGMLNEEIYYHMS